MADMLAVDPLDEQVNSATLAVTPPHVFEIVTSSVTYYVGVDMTGFSPADLKPSKSNDDDGSKVYNVHGNAQADRYGGLC